MKIATWNVNSIKAREERLLRWLDNHQPDVLCLQELKVADDAFPHEAVTQAGYRSVVHGQKTYNGVAILAREELADVRMGLQDDEDDPQARIVSARVADITVLSVYVPNGGSVSSDKYAYKLRWYARLLGYLERNFTPSSPLLVCGDFNVAPDERDVARPEEWSDTVLCAPEVRAAFTDLLAWGLSDCFRRRHQEGGLYSWWDYRQLGFPKNNGLRIDHILGTEPVAARCSDAGIDRQERKGKLPSDHAPVWIELS